MKNFLCGLGIFFLVILIALPPTLRIMVPKESKEETEEEKINIQTLSCDGITFLSRTSYENDKIKTIVIKRNNGDLENNEDGENTTPEVNEETNNQEENSEDTTGDSNPDSDNSDTNSENSLEPIFTALSEDSRVSKRELEDGVVITIDFSVTNIDNDTIGDLTNPIADQKAYYENQGLTCSVIE